MAQAIEYAYLRELPVKTLPELRAGWYVMTVEFANDGFSREPEQSKALHALELENGRLTFQPGNHVWFRELSFTVNDAPPSWLRRQTRAWGAETWQG